jgi:hypothetical protein
MVGPMIPSTIFLRFAAECESMVRLCRDRENKLVWRRLAERWIRCAELAERQSLAAHDIGRRKRTSCPLPVGLIETNVQIQGPILALVGGRKLILTFDLNLRLFRHR